MTEVELVWTQLGVWRVFGSGTTRRAKWLASGTCILPAELWEWSA